MVALKPGTWYNCNIGTEYDNHTDGWSRKYCNNYSSTVFLTARIYNKRYCCIIIHRWPFKKINETIYRHSIHMIYLPYWHSKSWQLLCFNKLIRSNVNCCPIRKINHMDELWIRRWIEYFFISQSLMYCMYIRTYLRSNSSAITS